LFSFRRETSSQQESPAQTRGSRGPTEFFELPGADLSAEELSVRVIPKRADEFTCSSCFLVQHRSRLAGDKDGQLICADCAG
jgi:hypothetical protein